MRSKITVTELYHIVSDAFAYLIFKGFEEQTAVQSICYILYGIHKQYPNGAYSPDIVNFRNEEDNLLTSLYIPIENYYLVDLYRRLSSIPHDDFEDIYPYVLPTFSIILQKDTMILNPFDFPEEIKAIVAYHVNYYGCKSVYDPTCSNVSIVKYLDKDCKYVGQSNNLIDALVARMYHEAIRGYDADITNSNPFSCWRENQYAAVITSWLAGVKQNPLLASQFTLELKKQAKTIEEGFIRRAFDINNTYVVVSLLPVSFLQSSMYDNLRRELIERNLLDSVFLFPDNTMPFTSIAPAIIVCRRIRGNEPVKLYDVSRWYKESNAEMTGNAIDFSRFDCTNASIDDIRSNNYILYPNFYTDASMECMPGQRIVKLGELINTVSNRRIDNFVEADQIIIPLESFSRNYVDVWKNKNNPIVSNHTSLIKSPQVYQAIEGKTYLLDNRSPLDHARFALYSGYKQFIARNAKVMIINEDIIDPEYLVYQLITNPRIKNLGLPLSRCMNLSIAIDSNKVDQKALVVREKQKYAQRMREEQEADEKRLGVKQNISDLEHMLGSTQLRINNIISVLKDITPASDMYQSIVKDLQDNVEYLNRMIRFSYNQITAEMFNKKKGNIADFLKHYADAWENYGGNYFKLVLRNYIDKDIDVNFDKTLLTVLFDSILSNAARHGFHKNSHYTNDNRVVISLTLRSFQDKAYVLISVANNGDPIKEGFTLNDYITKGRFTADSGRSGLGGYHIHKITKGHDGYLYIHSNKTWNVIVDILLPAEGVDSDFLILYDNECV